MRSYEYLQVTLDGGVATVVMNRPDKLNAFNHEMHIEMARIWPDLRADPEVRAVILTGAGRAFSAGGDFSWIEEVGQDFEKIREMIHGEAVHIVENLISFDKPLVAAVNGPALGLGATLTFLSDFVIASDEARIGDTHVPAGAVAGDGAVVVLPLLIGLNRAKELMLTGRILTAREAQEFGLLNQLVAGDQLMLQASEFARNLAEMPTWALRWTKRSLNQWLRMAATFTLDSASSFEALTMFTEDYGRSINAVRARNRGQH